MIKYILNFPLNQKIKQFGSFFILIFLLTATVIIVNTYGNFKSEQIKDLRGIIENTYFQKTLK